METVCGIGLLSGRKRRLPSRWISEKNCGMTSGLGKGGDIITLGKEIYRTNDIGYVLRCIEDKRVVLKPVTVSWPVEEAVPAFG